MHGQPRQHAIIPQHVRLLLAELELISHGSTQSWNSAGGAHGDNTAVLPYGESNPPHVYFRDLYLTQTTDEGRQRVVGKICGALREARGHIDRSHVVGETREQEDTRIISQGEGFTADEVAHRFNCTPSRVRRARLAAGRSQHDGKPTQGSLTVTDGRIEALRMKEQGMSVRAIAMVLNTPPSTVGDWVKAA